MILSVSRRTDIPCRYSEWFMNRIREGSAVVRNPFNAGQLGRIPMTPEQWTALFSGRRIRSR